MNNIDFGRLAPKAGTRMLVVGGCGGIGRQLVLAALDLGLELAVLDTSLALKQYLVPSNVKAVSVDITDNVSVEAAFAEIKQLWGGLDVLVHLPGYTMPPTPVEDIEPAQWEDLVSVNLSSLYRVARRALPLMRGPGGGNIITIASGLAVHVEKGVSAYAASKAGVIAFTKALARENAPMIRANVVAPGAVDTAFLRGGTGRVSDNADKNWFDASFGGPDILKTIPMGRIAVPDDVVGPILFLAGDASRFMTGQVLYVNGGRLTP
ncbi:MAG: SDR family oxidoreductase [Rhizobiales bacterium]|nr:SDR family oxidoreductase [Hyphomicrobiales bacterium]